MRSPNKPRTRNKPGRRSPGNVINRVFESTGPEGKVRGNPQQIIEKYLALSRDALLGGDRVASENFAQHSEHYARLLNEAQREIERINTEILQEWVMGKGKKPVSWGTLTEVLRHIELCALASEIEEVKLKPTLSTKL